MVVSLIQARINDFGSYLNSQFHDKDQSLWLWEWCTNWQDAKATIDRNQDFLRFFESGMSHSKTKRFWQEPGWFPRDAMIQMIKFDPSFLQMMFSDLFNNDKNLSGRLDRFVFYCDNLWERFNEEKQIKLLRQHDHDQKFVINYLSLEYPEKYPFYDADHFFKCLIAFQAKDQAETFDPERFYKVSPLLFKLLKENPSVQTGLQKQLGKNEKLNTGSQLQVSYFCSFVAKSIK